MLSPQLVELFGRIRRCGFVGGGVSLGVDFGFSKAQTFPISFLCPLLLDKDVCSQLLLQHHAYLPTAMLHTR